METCSRTPAEFVRFSPSLGTVIVAHQGTEPTQLYVSPVFPRCTAAHRHNPCGSFTDLTDLDFFMELLNPSLFPGIPSSVRVHNGFAREQARYTRYVSILTVHSLLTKVWAYAARHVRFSAPSNRHCQRMARPPSLSSVTRSARRSRSLMRSSLACKFRL
jgi:hypothetical protein